MIPMLRYMFPSFFLDEPRLLHTGIRGRRSGGDDLRALVEGQSVMMLHLLITQSCTVACTASESSDIPLASAPLPSPNHYRPPSQRWSLYGGGLGLTKTVLLPLLVLGFRIENIVQRALHSQGGGSNHKAISLWKRRKSNPFIFDLRMAVTCAKILGKLLFQLKTVISVFTLKLHCLSCLFQMSTKDKLPLYFCSFEFIPDSILLITAFQCKQVSC